MKTKYSYLFFIAVLALTLPACKKTSLALTDPVNPSITSINTEAGIFPFALGIWSKAVGGDYWVAAHNHSIMGDEAFIPWGNWGWRWVSQVYQIILPDGTVVANPIGPTQKVQLQSTNSRDAGDLNAFQYEWRDMYFTIATTNVLLNSLNSGSFTFSGDATTKKNVLKAWGYYWRGWAYSRLGSMYLAGVVNNVSGTSSILQNKYVAHDAIITEANNNLDSAISILSAVSANITYLKMMGGDASDKSISIVPAFCNTNGTVTPDMWKRLSYTLKARNYLVNHKTSAMTATDWSAVLTLANSGMQAGDYSFTLGFTADGLNDIVGGFWTPAILLSDNNGNGGWLFVSERLIQEFKSGDARLAKNFTSYGVVIMNPRSRGLQYGTTWVTVDVESGGTFTTRDNSTNVQTYIAPSYEENELMKAEAKINSSQVDAGLANVDNVRNYQGAGLTAVSGTGLSLAQAKEELRSERRVALFLRGCAFYDARRWGVTTALASGGGRTNANVLVPAGYGSYTTSDVRACTMNYNYMDYWDVPQNELDFNAAASGSASVKN